MHLLRDFDTWEKDKYEVYRMYRHKMGLKARIKREHWTQKLSNEQKFLVDNFYDANYGKKIEYLWHEWYMSFTGNFDVQYFPDIIYMSEFERYQNHHREYVLVLENKDFLSYIVRGMGIEVPQKIISYICGVCGNDSKGNRIPVESLRNVGKIFLKPALGTCGGTGCMLLEMKNGKDQISDRKLENILEEYQDNFIIQECIETSDTLLKLYPNSVNTFRIATYRWKDQFYHCPVVMRIGRGGANVDNASSGGIFVAVNDDGVLQDRAFLWHGGDVFYSHPDTGVRFDGYKIDEVPLLIQTALKCHENIPEIGSINWDFTIGKDGNPILLEANINDGGAAELVQKSHGRALFGDRTAEILRWLKFMRKIPLSKREPYLFGNGVD